MREGQPDPVEFCPNTAVTILELSGLSGKGKPSAEFTLVHCAKHNDNQKKEC